MQYLKAGVHDPVEVLSHALVVASTGSLGIEVVFRDPATGAQATWHGYFTDKAKPHTARALAAMGWDPGANGWALEALNGTDLLVGRRVQVVVQEEPYERTDGSRGTFPKVRWVNECGRAAARGKGADAADVARLAAELRAKAGLPPVSSPPPSLPGTAPDPSVPF